jgi:putative membrane protein
MARRTTGRQGRGRDDRATTRVRDAAAEQAARVREALRVAALAALAALALGATACSGGDTDGQQDPREAYKNEAPARGGDAEVTLESDGATDLREMPGGGAIPAARVDQNTRELPGTSGSGTAASGWPSGSIGTPGSGVMGDGPLSDASIRATLDAMHTIEAKLSRLGAQKAQHPVARQYATAMIAAHTASGNAGQAAPRTGDGVSDLLTYWVEMDAKTRRALTAMRPGPAFDVAFANAQVQSHEAALQTLDRLESDASAPALVSQIRAQQVTVERHLVEARAVQATVARALTQPAMGAATGATAGAATTGAATTGRATTGSATTAH